MRVYHREQNRVEFVQNEKYIAKSSDYLRFYAYLCHVIDEFQLLCFCSTKVSDISDMAKS